jgi:hypothetical protein
MNGGPRRVVKPPDGTGDPCYHDAEELMRGHPVVEMS